MSCHHLLRIARTHIQFYHDLITMRGAMPTHLGRTHEFTLITTTQFLPGEFLLLYILQPHVYLIYIFDIYIYIEMNSTVCIYIILLIDDEGGVIRARDPGV